MSVENSLARPPFNLSLDDIAWVRQTRDSLSTSAKIRQLFVQIVFGPEVESLLPHQLGGFNPLASSDLQKTWDLRHRLISESQVPPFLSNDLEGGGNHTGALTAMPNQLAFAAVPNATARRAALEVLAEEASAMGINWTFTPCIDINHAFKSAIVGTRSYGSNLEVISANAQEHVDILQRHGIATTAKHWPGEGYDDRDQHLVTTVNPQSTAQWQDTFGKLYGGLIKSGILSVMSAHIALPAYAAAHGIPESLERYHPASLSSLLNESFLRGELGFNGLIVSDATPMAGLTSAASRSEQVPGVIQAGCDVFLFCDNVEEDIRHMESGLRKGLLTEQRLEDAITRVLGMKAALGLHRKTIRERIKPLEEIKAMIADPAHTSAARAVADQAVTLVKDTKSILPINPSKHRRITWIGRPAPGFLPGMPETPMQDLHNGLAARGFIVSDFNPDAPPTPDNTDCVLYVLPTESSLGKSRIFIDWLREQPGMNNIMNRYWHDIPTVMISFGHPYHLYDAPRVSCYINAYSNIPASQLAVLERLTGNAPFSGVSPIDPFAGAPDAKY
jgi:beta-N-acetylhexosaminidase